MNSNYSKILSSKIAHLRKLQGLTQEELAQLLGVSIQAVSKWENNIWCPDISLLPRIAYIFNVSIDELFGKNIEKEVTYSLISDLFWYDDDKYRIALFCGKKLINHELYECKEGSNTFTFKFFGDNYDLIGSCKIDCKEKY